MLTPPFLIQNKNVDFPTLNRYNKRNPLLLLSQAVREESSLKKTIFSILLTVAVLSAFGVLHPYTVPIMPNVPAAEETSLEEELIPSDPSWQTVQEKGTLTIGVRSSFPPMTFSDENGALTGMDIELAKAVCETLNIEPEFKIIDNWHQKETLLAQGEIDCIWSAFSLTPEYEKTVRFSQPYLITKLSVLASQNVWVTDMSALPFCRIGAEEGSSAWEMFQSVEDYESLLPNVIPLDTCASGLEMLANGTLDVFVVDQTYAKYQMEQSEAFAYFTAFDFGDDLYAVGFRPKDEMLANEVDRALQSLIADGTAHQIAQHWLEESDILIP